MYFQYEKEVLETLQNNNTKEILELFAIFDHTEREEVYKTCYLWIHWFFPDFFTIEECEEQIQILKNNCDYELGIYKTVTEVGFRGLGKTTLAKLVAAFFLANNQRTDRGKYCKVVSADEANSRQVVTDLYNMLVEPRVLYHYTHLWRKTNMKRVETQQEFDLSTGVKVKASTIEKRQRGNIQMASRPDRVWFEDVEDALTIRSLAETVRIWKVMDEAYQGLSPQGRALYNVNYISKRGNVHKIVMRAKKDPDRHHLHVVPIRKGNTPTWYHTNQQIDDILRDADDPDGDYMCDPKNPYDSYFNEKFLNMHLTREPIAYSPDKKWRYFSQYDKTHVYAMGVDPSGGNGGDNATIAVIDLTVGELAAMFCDKFTDEAKLGDEANEKGKLYGNCIVGVESNNHGHAVLLQLRHRNYPNLFMRVEKSEYDDSETPKLGFETNKKTKPAILSSLSQGINHFSIRIPCEKTQAELLNFPREYVDAGVIDEELGHFDRVMALAIAWEMRLYTMTSRKLIVS